MSKGGGGGTQQVVQTNLPEYAEPYLERIFATGETEYIQPYTQYMGRRTAEESPQRQMVNQGIEALAETGAPYFGEAMDLQRGVIRQFQEPQEFTAETAQRYMDPFLDQVLERQKAGAIEDYQKQAASRAAKAVEAGAFGGSREGIMQAEAERGLLNKLADIEATGRKSAYESAQDLFAKDRAYRSGALGSQAELASGLAGLGAQSQTSLIERLAQLEGVGKAEEARRQLTLDEAYDEFIRQEEYPMAQLERFNQLIRGGQLPTTQTTREQTSALTQLAGLGITGLSLANLGVI